MAFDLFVHRVGSKVDFPRPRYHAQANGGFGKEGWVCEGGEDAGLWGLNHRRHIHGSFQAVQKGYVQNVS